MGGSKNTLAYSSTVLITNVKRYFTSQYFNIAKKISSSLKIS